MMAARLASNVRLVMVALAFLIALSNPVSAQTTSKTVELLPGGKTIGGPGTGSLEGGPTAVPDDIFSNRGTPTNVCVTVTNLASGGLSLVALIVNGDSDDPIMVVLPARTGAVCSDAVETLGVRCVGGQINQKPRCQYLWRVDSK